MTGTKTKVYVFAEIFKHQQFYWLAVVAILNSVISNKKNSFRTKLTKIYSKLIELNFKINSHGIVTAVLILIILIYWHIPEVFTFAWHNDSFHIKMHISYITIGILIFLMDKVTSLLEKSIFTIIIGKFMLIGGTIIFGILLWLLRPLFSMIGAFKSGGI